GAEHGDGTRASGELVAVGGEALTGGLLDPVEQRVAVGQAAREDEVGPLHPTRQLVGEPVLAALLERLDGDRELEPGALCEHADLHAVDLEQEARADRDLSLEPPFLKHWPAPPPTPGP